MKKTVISKLAVLLFSLIFVSTNTEGYSANLTTDIKTNSYNTSSIYDFNFFINNISEPTEEEAELDSFHQKQILSALTSYISFPIEIFSESLTFQLQKPNFNESLEKPKTRAPPLFFI
ncbi:hypothetical protein ND861_02245 [Leptospira sp. 2 VSF19]|uniref:Uncharacterized protein n=1 Tax=Leptospira soteropolitanensis TaxID=2950025 RepID=A0AAW5V885_9LEPT|nr:hypothetical protein [Leptospira soteropolitanensis]MCW7491468.1 hypothetical protein [Leptospira soteropolitanensis]MCW7499052.1 hypothetical protein [Leptospira soteropolitanensis]MCW7521356.1 hypothetical protein [Leptospira soteropolitanensis]MCW7525156.1 hypothetical protein [Leptospira soteropolitanensis]MCW7529023.1 hypothetical protein [Leptospira soteropolitanensis]